MIDCSMLVSVNWVGGWGNIMRHIRGASVAAIVGVFVLLVGLPFASADLVLNGGFEEPDISPLLASMVPPGSLTGWTVTNGNIEIVDNAYWQSAEGDQSIDMNAGGHAGSISQDIATGPGGMYYIDFALTGNWRLGPPTKSMQVWWDGVMVEQFDITKPVGWSESNMGWQHYRIGKLAAGAGAFTTIEFVSVTDREYGPVLDDVSVTPEPGTLALMALGLAGLVAARRRRKEDAE